MAKITEKQKRFANEYLIDLNGTQAAIRAGYAKKNADVQAVRLLGNVRIKEYLQVKQDKLKEKTEVTQEMIINELKKIGFSDMRNFSAWGSSGVRLEASSELSDGDAACVAEVSETTTKDGGSIKFKLHDKVKSLELLGKTLGIFTDKLEHTGDLNINVTLDD